MRTKTEIFDEMLTITATLGYPFEKPFYQNPLWECSKNIVDIGSGNAEYISILSKDYPTKCFTGIEKNSSMAKIASEKHKKNSINIINSDYTEVSHDLKFDFFIARRSIVHIPSRNEFYNWIQMHSNKEAGVLVIETDMVNFDYNNKLPIFSKLYSSLNNKTTTENYGILRHKLENEFTENGFTHVSTIPLIINTSIPGIKEKFYIYMRLVSELALGAPIPSNLAEELFNWFIDTNAYAENYIYGALFKK